MLLRLLGANHLGASKLLAVPWLVDHAAAYRQVADTPCYVDTGRKRENVIITLDHQGLGSPYERQGVDNFQLSKPYKQRRACLDRG